MYWRWRSTYQGRGWDQIRWFNRDIFMRPSQARTLYVVVLFKFNDLWWETIDRFININETFTVCSWFGLMVFNAYFNNIAAIPLRSALIMKETEGSGENHWPVASRWQSCTPITGA